jgi:predicted RNA-binding Zn-ribbon protein involved in translation (DUF1610 family)
MAESLPDTDPGAVKLCPHMALVRDGAQVQCTDCGATAAVPRCLGCRDKTKKAGGEPQLTTWIVREAQFVCYKCGETVPGLVQRDAVAA